MFDFISDMRIGELEQQLQLPPEPKYHPEPEKFKVALSNISSSASALQPRGDLFGLLAGMDQVYAESYLRVSEKADSRRPSPFSGLLLALNYDPVAVQNLVDEIWPFRWQRRSGPGRKPEDPLPLVCYILPYCDPEYGTVFNVLDAYRHLEEDKEYRNLCGYSYRVPSRSVFNNVVVAMVDSWSSFQACLLSPEDLEKVKARLLAGAVEELNGPAGGDETPALRAVLDHLGWDGGCPPDYRDEGRFSKVLRTVGLPRGRSCSSGGEIGPPVAEVSSAAGVGAASPSKGPRARDWAAYNDAQTHEALDVKAMIGGFCDQINFLEAQCQPEGYNRRREFPLGHSVFGVLQKAYSRRASRPHEGLLFESVEQGYLRNMPTLRSLGSTGTVVVAASEFVRIPSYNAVTSYLRSLWLTPLLLELVTVTALPLRGLERVFAVDGSGMSSRWYDRWLDHRLGIESDRQQWVKLHLVVGLRDWRGRSCCHLARVSSRLPLFFALGGGNFQALRNRDRGCRYGLLRSQQP